MTDIHAKKRLVWRCRRGMLELDLLLNDFLKGHLNSLSEQDLGTFERLLGATDPELFAWLMGHEEPQDKEFKKIVASIRNHD